MRPGHRTWTPDEDALLKILYGKVKAKDLYLHLADRTPASVSGRLSWLGIRVPKVPDWSESELVYLRQNYGKMSPEKLAKELGRTSEAVHIKATRLRLHARKQRLTPRSIGEMMRICSKQVKRWIDHKWLKAQVISRVRHTIHAVQPEDLIEFLKAHPDQWDARRCPDIHLKLGIRSKRTGVAKDERPLWLKEKLAKDIRKGRQTARWTRAEDVQLAHHMQRGLRYKRVGELMGRTEQSISRRVGRLGRRLWDLLKQQIA
jgi:hypothetical protein